MILPNHIAIIPDGNRRWAKEKNLPKFEGHRKGLENTLNLGKYLRNLGVKIFTIWGFSTENWQRERNEVKYLMDLFKKTVDQYLKEALKNEIRLIHLGRKDRFDNELKEKIIKAEKETEKFSKYYFCLGLDYGGQDEIIRMIKKIKKYREIDKSIIEKNLDTKDLPYPYPDLIIRTGGEKRLSGFMLWQSEYSELYFSKKYFPDFNEKDLYKALKDYSKRQRRFGK
ncbi:MAG: polyprenyl diphosphate synthase [Microgenomates group bacterium]